jgi:hypothetical protein
MKILEQIEIDLRSRQDTVKTVYVNVYDNSLSRKWLRSLDDLLSNHYHLEKNYCFLGFAEGERNGDIILDQINCSIEAINAAGLGYVIDDHFTLGNTVESGPVGPVGPAVVPAGPAGPVGPVGPTTLDAGPAGPAGPVGPTADVRTSLQT